MGLLTGDPHADTCLVLGASPEKGGPGPIVTALSRSFGSLPVPLTIVPGNMSKEQLEAVT